MNDTIEYLKTLPYWSNMSEAEKYQVESAAFIRHYEPGTMLYGMNDSTMGMIVLLSGEVRAFIFTEEGREITLYRLQEGELGILSPSCAISQITFETHLIATQVTDVLVIPTAEYDDLVQRNIYVRCFTYELTAQRFSVIMWIFQQILFARFDQRLASFLVEEYRRTGSEEICMTQEQIAEYVNSAREVVARMLRRFAVEGWVENRRGNILLKDIGALTKLGGAIQPPEELTVCS